MKVSLVNKKFVRYAKSTPARVPCWFGKDGYDSYVFCYRTTTQWTGLGTLDDDPLILVAAGFLSGAGMINATSATGEQF